MLNKTKASCFNKYFPSFSKITLEELGTKGSYYHHNYSISVNDFRLL